MTVKDYLNQGRYLNSMIEDCVRRAETYRSLAYKLGSPGLGERVQTSRRNEATFAEAIDNVADSENEIKEIIGRCLELKKQIQAVIDSLDDYKEREILQYRYIDDYSFTRIAEITYSDRSTVYRRHNRAIEHVVMPKNPIFI